MTSKRFEQIGRISAAVHALPDDQLGITLDVVNKLGSGPEWKPYVVAATRRQSVLADGKLPYFVPICFGIRGLEYAEQRHSRSAALGVIDYRRVVLSQGWLDKDDGGAVAGYQRRRRLLEDRSMIPLHSDHFLDLWCNPEKIPKQWREPLWVTFDGDEFTWTDKRRCFLAIRYVHDWEYGLLGCSGSYNDNLCAAVYPE